MKHASGRIAGEPACGFSFLQAWPGARIVQLRVRAETASALRIPGSRRLRPLLNREFLTVGTPTPADAFNRRDQGTAAKQWSDAEGTVVAGGLDQGVVGQDQQDVGSIGFFRPGG
jgi:hypothetical protein